MPEIVRTEEVIPASLSLDDRAALTAALYAAQAEIFDGVSREAFQRYVIDSPAQETRIKVFYGGDGQVGGYVAVHFFDHHFAGEPCTVVRAEAGLKRAYRGGNAVGSFLAEHILSGWMKSSGRVFYLGSLVHPSSYCALARHAPTVWPSPGSPIPPDVLAFMCELGETFGLTLRDASRPLVREVGWITRDTPAERRYWETCDRPLARFFIEQNPEYTDGDGLLTLIPMSTGTLAQGLLSWGTTRLQRGLDRLTSQVMETVWPSGIGPDEIDRLLSLAAPLSGLPAEIIHELAESGTRQTLSPGEVLFYEDDAADTLYLVLEGSIFLLRGERGVDEVILDQLGPGSMIGEISLVLSTVRTATARAATRLTLLRLDHHALHTVRDAHPEVDERIWYNVGFQLLANRSRAHPRLHSLTQEQLRAWYDAGTQHALRSGASVTAEAGWWVLVVDGDVDVDGEDDQALLHEMSLMRLHGTAQIYAPFKVRLVLLPPRG